jgi:AbrB family looped-hinge helix DNA binding protein
MSEYIARVTSKGQLTLPSELRKRLGISSGDTVTFKVIEQTAVLEKYASAVESVRGSFPTPPHMVGRDLDEMIEEATANHAEWLMRQERGSTR